MAMQSRRALYSHNNLTVVDWEGAIVVAGAGDFESVVEQLKIGNYQHLRYRMLDRQIEDWLRERLDIVAECGWRSFPVRRLHAPWIIEQRLPLRLDPSQINQALLVIGDWYSARVYRLIINAFHLQNWNELVRAKLGNLAAIQEGIQARLRLTLG